MIYIYEPNVSKKCDDGYGVNKGNVDNEVKKNTNIIESKLNKENCVDNYDIILSMLYVIIVVCLSYEFIGYLYTKIIVFSSLSIITIDNLFSTYKKCIDDGVSVGSGVGISVGCEDGAGIGDGIELDVVGIGDDDDVDEVDDGDGIELNE